MRVLKKIKQKYDNLRIQTKFALCILLAILTPFVVLGGGFAGSLYSMVASDTIRNEQGAAMNIAPKIDSVLEKVEECYEILSISLKNASQEGWEEELRETIKMILEKGIVVSVRIYVDLPESASFFTSTSMQEVFVPLAKVRGTYWHGMMQESRPKNMHCPPFYLGAREMRENGDCAYIVETNICVQKQLYPCYVAIYYNSDVYEVLMEESKIFRDSVSYIISDRDAVIATTDDYLTGMFFINYEDVSNSLLSSNNFIERNILGEGLYVSFNAIQRAQWFLITVTPNKPLRLRTLSVLIMFGVLCFLCIISAYCLAMWQARSITTRISQLVQQMAEGRKGSPESMPASTIHDEVGELIDTYNYMTGKINELLEKQRITAEDLRIAEFNSLQAQINPHFLYNTMDMIHWMALKGQTAEISNAVQRLAKFYKLTLSHKSNFMSIDEEINHVSIYVELQNMRFKNAINFVVDIQDELLHENIPKLTLQPIVENAIIHGILEKEDKRGSIVITGWREKNRIELLVSDDGVGMPEEKCAEILSGQHVSNMGGTNIAVYNIHKRLKLLYGEGYGLHYSSIEGQGTEVKIILPYSVS